MLSRQSKNSASDARKSPNFESLMGGPEFTSYDNSSPQYTQYKGESNTGYETPME